MFENEIHSMDGSEILSPDPVNSVIILEHVIVRAKTLVTLRCKID